MAPGTKSTMYIGDVQMGAAFPLHGATSEPKLRVAATVPRLAIITPVPSHARRGQMSLDGISLVVATAAPTGQVQP